MKREYLKQLNLTELYRKYGIVCVLILLFITASLLNENFTNPQNLVNILLQITPIAIIAAAQTMLIVSGNIDLSAGAVAGLSASLSAGALVATGSLPISIVVGMGSGAAFSFLSGTLVTVFKLPPFIATLAMMNVARGLVIIYTGGVTIRGLEPIRWLGQGRLFGVIPNLIILMVIVLIIVQIVMKKTKFGLYMYSIGGNKAASTAAGINVNRQIRLTYLFSGSLIGLAGITLNARMMAAHPGVGPGYEFDAITATIVGGTSFLGGVGSMYCVMTGAVIIGIINNLMILMGVDTSWQMVVKGFLIALAVALDIFTKRSRQNTLG
ncbi:MAG: ABC transporter permease [Oscillospiraceae bacterium]|nr:ABC transporter permease [Oscillospiraceae bacterium]MCL2278372.1 ABC transporter permease [Oscillospiraceae bacterium]